MNLRTECHHQNRQNRLQVEAVEQAAAGHFAAVERRWTWAAAVAHYTAVDVQTAVDYRQAQTVAVMAADRVPPYHPDDCRASASAQ